MFKERKRAHSQAVKSSSRASYCPQADVSIEGRFAVEQPPFAQLVPGTDHWFVEIFVRNEGKLNRMEDELGLS